MATTQKGHTGHLKALIPTPKRLFIRYPQESVAKYGAPYVLFGVFFTINYILPSFMWAQAPTENDELVLTIRLVGGILCGLLIVKEKWAKPLLPYMPTFWYLTLLYCLPFNGTIMFLLTHGSTEWLINIAIIIILLFVLVDWLSALILGLAGVALGFIFYAYFVGAIHLSLDFNSKYLLIYQLIFGVLIGLIFARRRELSFSKLASQRNYFKAIQQETSSRLAETLRYREELLKELNPDDVPIFDDVTTAYMKQAIYRVTDYLRLEVTKFQLDQLLEESLAMLELQDLEPVPQLLPKNYTRLQEIQADPAKLKRLLVNSLVYVQKHNTDNAPINIVLEDATLGYELPHMKGYTKKLKALRFTITNKEQLPPIKDNYQVEPIEASTSNVQHKTEPLLAENVCITEAHYGYIDVSQPTTHVYVIPTNLREIRGKVMELLRKPAAEDAEEVKHPLAIQLEKELLDKLQGTGVNLEVIHKALKTIKRYHGGVRRKSGEPFFTHPMNVALILLEHSQDQDAIVAALLHDTVEDTSLSMTHIRAMFGETVAFLVEKATNLVDEIRRLSLQDHENIHRLLHCEDPRAALVKLSDRMHNMRTIEGHPAIAKQKRIANETLTFFVPLAQKLALNDMAEELEKLSLEVLNKQE